MTTSSTHAKQAGSGSQAPVSSHWRDIAIAFGALAVISIGYFLIREPGLPPQPPSGAPGHDNMGMEMLGDLPTTFDGLVAAGNKQMDEGEYVVAAEIYRRALEIQPNATDVRVDFGTCLFAMGLPERAREEFTQALTEQPNHGIATFNMGIVFNHLGKRDSAEMFWKRYLEIQPEGPTADRARDLLAHPEQ